MLIDLIGHIKNKPIVDILKGELKKVVKTIEVYLFLILGKVQKINLEKNYIFFNGIKTEFDISDDLKVQLHISDTFTPWIIGKNIKHSMKCADEVELIPGSVDGRCLAIYRQVPFSYIGKNAHFQLVACITLSRASLSVAPIRSSYVSDKVNGFVLWSEKLQYVIFFHMDVVLAIDDGERDRTTTIVSIMKLYDGEFDRMWYVDNHGSVQEITSAPTGRAG